jgi:hypothetical protein
MESLETLSYKTEIVTSIFVRRMKDFVGYSKYPVFTNLTKYWDTRITTPHSRLRVLKMDLQTRS